MTKFSFVFFYVLFCISLIATEYKSPTDFVDISDFWMANICVIRSICGIT